MASDKDETPQPLTEAQYHGLAPLAPDGRRLPDSPPTISKPRKVVNGRREAVAVLDQFLHKKVTRQRLMDVFAEWLDTAPKSFIEKVLIPLTPKALVEEGIEKEAQRDAVIQIVTNVPRPDRAPSTITLTIGKEPTTIDVEGVAK